VAPRAESRGGINDKEIHLVDSSSHSPHKNITFPPTKRQRRTKRSDKKPLTEREKHFVREYLLDLNAERAAISAGYAKTTAAKKSYGWVGMRGDKPNVGLAIKKAMDKRAARIRISQDAVVQELAKIAFLDPSALFDADGRVIPIQKLPKEVAAAIAGLDVSQSGDVTTTKVKLSDKKGALELLGRHLHMFLDKVGIGSIGADGELTDRVMIEFVTPPVHKGD